MQRLTRTDCAATPIGLGGAFTPFGHTGGMRSTWIGYCGQLPERPVCNYSLGHGYRFYLPDLARLAKPDTFSPFERGGLNAYAYCSADPVNRADPSGAAFRWLIESIAVIAQKWRAWRGQIAGMATFELVTHWVSGALVVANAPRIFNAAISGRNLPRLTNGLIGSTYGLAGAVLYPVTDELMVRGLRTAGRYINAASMRPAPRATLRSGQTLGA